MARTRAAAFPVAAIIIAIVRIKPAVGLSPLLPRTRPIRHIHQFAFRSRLILRAIEWLRRQLLGRRIEGEVVRMVRWWPSGILREDVGRKVGVVVLARVECYLRQMRVKRLVEGLGQRVMLERKNQG